ncbi:hypothetical protein GDO81_025934 [Engystomops pustulosus]|uniref:Uncharacterized protein n=1 Tax=Engystomops pustulosus TaxID=76066 RepID=A0AAV6YZX6_ENGPU|nr:hypothetical protein GDO81_025934 [Engystomops pustulosus]
MLWEDIKSCRYIGARGRSAKILKCTCLHFFSIQVSKSFLVWWVMGIAHCVWDYPYGCHLFGTRSPDFWGFHILTATSLGPVYTVRTPFCKICAFLDFQAENQTLNPLP